MENRKDCYARLNNDCYALKELSCSKCRFYRNDITREKIEASISKYSYGSTKRKEDLY